VFSSHSVANYWPSEYFADTTVRDTQLSWDVARPDSLVSHLDDPLTDNVWQWSPVDEDSAELVHSTVTCTHWAQLPSCRRLSWLPVSFLLHVKYTLSYRIVSCRHLPRRRRHHFNRFTRDCYADWSIYGVLTHCRTVRQHRENFHKGSVTAETRWGG